MHTEPLHTSDGYLKDEPTMRDVMTPDPRLVDECASLADAHAAMREQKCRHLPVMRGATLVGVVSERDLYLVETLVGANAEVDWVGDAMTPYVFTTTPDAKLRDVARVMAAERYGCAIVMDGPNVVGIFTATDAFKHLVAKLG